MKLRPYEKATPRSYALAMGLMAVAILLRWLTDAVLQDHFRLIFLYGVVAFAVWHSGWRPALLVTLLGYVISNYLFMGPTGAFDVSLQADLGFLAYLLSCSLFIGFGEANRHATLRLRKARHYGSHLAAIVAASNDAIISKSLDGTIQSWNTGAERLLGYREDEIVGNHVTLIVPSELYEEEDEILARIRRGERIPHFDTVRQRKDGALVELSVTISPVFDDEGNVTAASTVARDITERKQAEEALQEADRRKDEFLATLAHELRNPLAPISNSLELLRHADQNPKLLRQARKAIERQLNHMVRLVDDLLNVSRISRDKLTLRKSQTPLSIIVQQAVETAQPFIDEFCHSIDVKIPDQPVYLDADPVRLAQVLSNLLNNACKYTTRNGAISLTAEQQEDSVRIVVKDNGVGLTGEQLDTVFEIFNQVDSTLDHATGGLGIGLTLAKRLVEMHGGQITAKSEGLGHGSEFIVTLPILTHAVAEQPLPTGQYPSIGSPQRVLVVDDNTDSADTLAALLQVNGHEVRLAHDGVAAVEAAEDFRPNVILLDIGLPKLDGYGACEQIRAQDWGKDLIIVALTGWGQEEDRRRSHKAGFDAHLVKPVSYGALLKLLSSRNKSKTVEAAGKSA